MLASLEALKRPITVQVNTNSQDIALWLEKGYTGKDGELIALTSRLTTLVSERSIVLAVTRVSSGSDFNQVKSLAQRAIAEVASAPVSSNQVNNSLFTRDLDRVRVDAWVDGACSGNPGPGGWGVILKSGEHLKQLSGGDATTTNNRMELTAVLNAVNALKQPTELYIHTDSTLVIGLLSQGWKRKEATLRELCEQIEAAAQEKDVTLLFAR